MLTVFAGFDALLPRVLGLTSAVLKPITTGGTTADFFSFFEYTTLGATGTTRVRHRRRLCIFYGRELSAVRCWEVRRGAAR